MSKQQYPWWGYIKSIIRKYPGGAGGLSGVALRNHEAVQAAIEATERMVDGQSRLKVIRLLHWSKPRTLTLDGAALDARCGRATASRWQKRFYEEVAINRGDLDGDHSPLFVPVVHGRWENGCPICPVCGMDKFSGLDADVWSDWKPKHCPNCGAKMDL